MNKIFSILLVFGSILAFTACSSLEDTNTSSKTYDKVQSDSVEDLRDALKKHEFLGFSFYLPAEFTQSNIFADTDTGRVTYTDPQGINVLISIYETAFISQNYNKDISDAQSYAQVYYDNSTEETVAKELSSKYGVPYIRLCGNIDGITQFGFIGFYCSGNYCVAVGVVTENESVFSKNEDNMSDYATIAVFMR